MENTTFTRADIRAERSGAFDRLMIDFQLTLATIDGCDSAVNASTVTVGSEGTISMTMNITRGEGRILVLVYTPV